MRISDWSSDVCSSDLTSGASGVWATAGIASTIDAASTDETRRLSAAIMVSPCRSRLSHRPARNSGHRSEEHTSELQSLMRISYAVFCLKKKKKKKNTEEITYTKNRQQKQRHKVTTTTSMK